MKIRAYILVNVSAGAWQEVVKNTHNLPGVLSCDSVTGPYDAIIHAEVESMDELKQLVLKIQKVLGVERTVTCVIL